MLNLLTRLFVPKGEVQSAAVRGAYGRMAGGVGIACNVLLALGKLFAGLFSGSISIMADAVNNVSDAASSVITLAGFKLSSKPADKEHPFGHARFEYISGLCVAILVMMIGVELGRGSVDKIINPSPVVYSWLSIAVLVASILVKLWMAFFNREIGRRISSASLVATFVDSRNDVVATTAVLIAALIAKFTGIQLDGWMGLAVAVFILVSGFMLVKDTLNPLLGTAPDEELVERIRARICAYPGILGTHDLIVHDYGPLRRFASAHVEMASEDDVLKTHEIIDKIEKDIFAEEQINLIIHFDPIRTKGPEAAIRTAVENLVLQVDERLSIHEFDLRKQKNNSGVTYHFDVLAPADFSMTDDELEDIIQKQVRSGGIEAKVELHIDRSYAALPRQ